MAKSVIPNLADRLRAAQEARQAQLQRAKNRRGKPRSGPAMGRAAGDRRRPQASDWCAPGGGTGTQGAPKAAQRAAAEAEAAAARSGIAGRTGGPCRERSEAERVRREAAAQAEREALLAARRAGRKA